MSDIIKCLKCGNVLMSGSTGFTAIFGQKTTISCNKCGNSYTFGSSEPNKVEKK